MGVPKEIRDYPRKLSHCQYTVGSKDVCCMRGDGEAKKLALDKQLGPEVFGALYGTDPGVAAALAPGGSLATLRDQDFQARYPGWQNFCAEFSSGRPDLGYLGVPLWHRGHVLGTLCSQYAGDLNSQETMDARRKVLVKLAAKFSAEIDNITERTRTTPSPSAPLISGTSTMASAPLIRGTSTTTDHHESVANRVQVSPTAELVAPLVATSLHSLQGTTLAGKQLEMSQLAGKAVVVCNVASRCSLSPPSFRLLAALHEQHGRNLEILLYPSSEFGNQELPSDEVASFVASKGLPTDGDGCTVMSMVEINGPMADPVWATCKQAFPGDVYWNFGGVFLIDQCGAVIGRYRAPRQLDELGTRLGNLLRDTSSSFSV